MQTGKLKINGIDAYSQWKVFLTQGALGILLTPPSAKPYITNKSRLQHGERSIRQTSSGNNLSRINSRDISLPIAIVAADTQDLRIKLDSLVAELMKGTTEMVISEIPGVMYRLDYMSCTQFSQLRGLAKFVLKFNEPNPDNR